MEEARAEAAASVAALTAVALAADPEVGLAEVLADQEDRIGALAAFGDLAITDLTATAMATAEAVLAV